MKYFEQQRVDDIGILGVRIQKMVIVLTLLNFLAFLNPNFIVWVSAFVNQLLLLIAFCGALKRRDSLLRLYVIINVVIFILGVASAISMFFVFAHQRPEDSNMSDIIMPKANHSAPIPMNHSKPSPSTLLKIHQPKTLTLHKPEVDSEDGQVVFGPLFIAICALKVLALVLKITTIIYACRMARMLRTRRNLSLAHPTKSAPSNPPRGVYQPVVYVPINHPQMQGMPQGQGQAFQPYYQPFMFNPYLQQVQPPAQPMTSALQEYPSQV